MACHGSPPPTTASLDVIASAASPARKESSSTFLGCLELLVPRDAQWLTTIERIPKRMLLILMERMQRLSSTAEEG